MTQAIIPSRKKITPEAESALRQSTIEGHMVRLPGTLERPVYEAVNEVLTRLGGKWNRKARAHVFASDPTVVLAEVLDSERVPVKNPLAFFSTPPAVTARMIELSRKVWAPNMSKAILDPSAGEGALLLAARAAYPDASLMAFELDEQRLAVLRGLGIEAQGGDFLSRPLQATDTEPALVLMNPSFSIPQDQDVYVKHVLHAFDYLGGGRLIAVCPNSIRTKATTKTRKLRVKIKDHGFMEDLPDRAFRESGTDVGATLVVLDKW